MYIYLCLPFLATVFNLALVIFFLSTAPNAASSSIPVQYEVGLGIESTCTLADYEESCGLLDTPQNVILDGPISPRDDPHLKKMPGRDFMAYVMPDVATFYQVSEICRVGLVQFCSLLTEYICGINLRFL